MSACSENPPSGSPAVTVARVEIAPRDTYISPLDRTDFRRPILTYRVRLFDGAGRELSRTQFPVTFSSAQPLTADVDATGTVFSSSAGNVWIRAVVGTGDRAIRDSALLQLAILIPTPGR
ncbi:MAG: Ig-like domain-containing protein [Gemmatimonadaceae bacterium]|nr:Ig-like domain-containing protein [Gemmatimonadaceae bacterium]